MTYLFADSCQRAQSKAFLKSGVAALAVVLATPAFAQAAASPAAPASASVGTPDADTTQEVVVLGYARSIQNANTAKKNAVNVIEAVSAEDIGKLPDVSITDSLSRLTGVAVQQSAGRAKYISVRGFGPDYTTATVNGRVIATVDDNRRFDFGQYPGDLYLRLWRQVRSGASGRADTGA